MRKGIFSSDFHIGKKTDGVDRSEDLKDIARQIVSSSLKSGADFLVLGGDLFDTSSPSEEDITTFLSILNILTHEKSIFRKIYILVGNHERIREENRTSCFSFLLKLKSKYPNVILIDDFKMTKLHDTDYGPVYGMFIPHITLVQSEGYKSEQDYIESKIREVLDDTSVGKSLHYIVFSHLDLTCSYRKDSIVKKSNIYVSEVIKNGYEAWHVKPVILNGHVHDNLTDENLYNVGSPIHTDFQNCDVSKFFAMVTIDDSLNGSGITVSYKKTRTPAFRLFEYDLIGKDYNNLNQIPTMQEFLDSICQGDYVKFDLRMDYDTMKLINLDTFKSIVENKYECKVKQIVPTVVKERVARNEDQRVDLSTPQAIKVYIKNGKPKNAKRKFNLAMDFVNKIRSK